MKHRSMNRVFISVTSVVLAFLLGACGSPEPETIVIYSGRSESLVEPIIDQYRQRTNLDISVRYGDTAQLAVALAEEGEQTDADLFWAQDAGALGAVHEAGLLADLPDSLLALIPDHFRSVNGTWVATSGRARTLAYSTQRVDATMLPESIFDLADEAYSGRVGWAPTNGSFQAHVTAIRALVGNDETRSWLQAMRENGTKSYRNNTAIVQAIADGEIDFGLPNHYYLYRFKSEDPDFPVAQTFFGASDPGNLINVAGIGVLGPSDQYDAAIGLIDFLLSADAQQYFAQETYEYPVIDAVDPSVALPAMGRLDTIAPNVDLDALDDLESTLVLLREVGML
ncbi:MAG: iron ABC transporter substrate-binding protein [Rhodothermales bacterium]